MKKVVIKPIENYLLSSLINTINKTCNDIPSVDAIYLYPYRPDGEDRVFVDINVLCNNLEDGYEIYHYFNDMIDIVNKKTRFNVNFKPVESNIMFDRSNLVNGTIIFDRYCTLLEVKSDDNKRVSLEPPLQIDSIKPWEQNRPYFILKISDQENKLMSLYVDANVQKLIGIPEVMGIYALKCFINGFYRVLIEVVVKDESKIEEIEAQIKNEDLKLFINGLQVKISLVFGQMNNYNYNFREDKDVFENLKFLANGEIIFDRDGTLEELQDFCKSSVYQNYFKPIDYKIDFEPPIKLERIYKD